VLLRAGARALQPLRLDAEVGVDVLLRAGACALHPRRGLLRLIAGLCVGEAERTRAAGNSERTGTVRNSGRPRARAACSRTPGGIACVNLVCAQPSKPEGHVQLPAKPSGGGRIPPSASVPKNPNEPARGAVSERTRLVAAFPERTLSCVDVA
jgi:hypothetical protein